MHLPLSQAGCQPTEAINLPLTTFTGDIFAVCSKRLLLQCRCPQWQACLPLAVSATPFQSNKTSRSAPCVR